MYKKYGLVQKVLKFFIQKGMKKCKSNDIMIDNVSLKYCIK